MGSPSALGPCWGATWDTEVGWPAERGAGPAGLTRRRWLRPGVPGQQHREAAGHRLAKGCERLRSQLWFPACPPLPPVATGNLRRCQPVGTARPGRRQRGAGCYRVGPREGCACGGGAGPGVGSGAPLGAPGGLQPLVPQPAALSGSRTRAPSTELWAQASQPPGRWAAWGPLSGAHSGAQRLEPRVSTPPTRSCSRPGREPASVLPTGDAQVRRPPRRQTGTQGSRCRDPRAAAPGARWVTCPPAPHGGAALPSCPFAFWAMVTSPRNVQLAAEPGRRGSAAELAHEPRGHWFGSVRAHAADRWLSAMFLSLPPLPSL